MNWRKKKRVRIHLADPPGMELPSIEGLLVGNRRREGEYVIALPVLITDPNANPVPLEAQILVVRHERVTWYEEIR